MKTKTRNWSTRVGTFLFLHAVLFLYSLCSVFSKKAALSPFLSMEFLLFCGLLLLGLGLYAILWQQVLKRLPLTFAYVNKAVVIVWGILWGVLLFAEQIKWNMLVGAAIIVAGVVIMGTCHDE